MGGPILTQEIVDEARWLAGTGMTTTEVARRLGCGYKNLHRAIRGETWIGRPRKQRIGKPPPSNRIRCEIYVAVGHRRKLKQPERTGIYTVSISPVDFDSLSQQLWYITTKGYVQCISQGPYENKKMHQIVAKRMGLQVPEDKSIDHRDRNRLNNRRNNLRAATRGQQCANSICRNPHGFKGISVKKNRWRARHQATENGRQINIFIGSFETKEEAARAYDKFMRKKYGDYYYPNFPSPLAKPPD